MPTYDFEAGGKKISIDSPRALSAEEQQSIAAKSFGGGKPEGKPAAPVKTVDPIANLPGVGGRLSALFQHVINPQNAAERVQSIGMSAPLMGIARGGATALGLPGMAGPAAVGGAMEGGQAVAKGESAPAVAGKTALGAGTAAATELAITKFLGSPSATKMLEKAKSAIPEALEAIKARLYVHPLADEALLNVPSMGILPVGEVVKRLGKLRGESYTATVDEVRHAMNEADFSKNAIKAGDAFVARLVKDRKTGLPSLFEPSRGPVKNAIMSDTGRDVADALTTQTVGGIPAGLLGAGALIGAVPGMAGKAGKIAVDMFTR